MKYGNVIAYIDELYACFTVLCYNVVLLIILPILCDGFLDASSYIKGCVGGNINVLVWVYSVLISYTARGEKYVTDARNYFSCVKSSEM